MLSPRPQLGVFPPSYPPHIHNLNLLLNLNSTAMSENNASAKGTGDTQGAGATSSPPRQYRPPSPKSKSASPKGKSASPQAAEIESPPGVLPGQHWIQAAEVSDYGPAV